MYTSNIEIYTDKKELIEELSKYYNEALINDIINNTDPLTEYFFKSTRNLIYSARLSIT